MKQLEDLSDDRNKDVCIHCGEGLDIGVVNREHVPTRSLLDEPYPGNLPTVPVHTLCNSSFSMDEEYLVALLASVLSGTTEPNPRRFPAAARALGHSSGLRRRIGQTRRVQGALWGEPEIQWAPELERVVRVLVKNARGHALYELCEPGLSEPSWVNMTPLAFLTERQRDQFENVLDGPFWPEIGTRLFQRVASGDLLPGGWVELQPNVYRYAVAQESGEILVRIVLHEYLTAEVLWDESSIA